MLQSARVAFVPLFRPLRRVAAATSAGAGALLADPGVARALRRLARHWTAFAVVLALPVDGGTVAEVYDAVRSAALRAGAERIVSLEGALRVARYEWSRAAARTFPLCAHSGRWSEWQRPGWRCCGCGDARSTFCRAAPRVATPQ